MNINSLTPDERRTLLRILQEETIRLKDYRTEPESDIEKLSIETAIAELQDMYCKIEGL